MMAKSSARSRGSQKRRERGKRTIDGTTGRCRRRRKAADGRDRDRHARRRDPLAVVVIDATRRTRARVRHHVVAGLDVAGLVLIRHQESGVRADTVIGTIVAAAEDEATVVAAARAIVVVIDRLDALVRVKNDAVRPIARQKRINILLLPWMLLLLPRLGLRLGQFRLLQARA